MHAVEGANKFFSGESEKLPACDVRIARNTLGKPQASEG